MKTLMIMACLCMLNVVYGQWELIPLPENCGLTSVYFTDPLHGYIAGADASLGGDVDGGIILETFDGGETWDTLYDPEGSPSYIVNVVFNGDDGYTSNRYSNFYKTSNGGTSWDIYEFDGTEFIYESIAMPDAETVLIAGWSGEVFRVTDNGATIERVLDLGLPYKSIYDLQCTGDKCFLHTTDRVYSSVDAGAHWTTALDMPGAYFRCMHVSPEAAVYVVRGDDASNCTLLYSPDAGVTWDTLSNFIYFDEVFNRMDMIGDLGYIVGYDYAMMQTINGGLTWTIVPLEEPAGVYGTLTDVDLVSPTVGYAIGDDGLFYRLGDPTAITEIATSQIRIYPNPATDHITISLDNPSGVGIYNTLGELIYATEAETTITIDVDTWPPGYYMARLDGGSVGFVVR